MTIYGSTTRVSAGSATEVHTEIQVNNVALFLHMTLEDVPQAVGVRIASIASIANLEATDLEDRVERVPGVCTTFGRTLREMGLRAIAGEV